MNEKKEVLFNIEDIYRAYNDCIKHKRSSKDYLEYELKYGKDDLFTLLDEINSRTYKVGKSYTFIATKPKLREIFAASFRDRIVHHLVVSILEPYFEKRFIKNVFSCRKGKGALLGIRALFHDIQKCEKDTFYLQMDIKSFFMSIDKDILFEILNKHLRNKNFSHYLLLRYLVKEIIYNDPTIGVEKKGDKSLFEKIPMGKSLFHLHGKNCGLPIGNLTSQLFSNIYLSDFDKYIKNELGCKYYGRYVDDFIIVHTDKNYLTSLISQISNYLQSKLGLTLHPNKIYIIPFGMSFISVEDM